MRFKKEKDTQQCLVALEGGAFVYVRVCEPRNVYNGTTTPLIVVTLVAMSGWGGDF